MKNDDIRVVVVLPTTSYHLVVVNMLTNFRTAIPRILYQSFVSDLVSFVFLCI